MIILTVDCSLLTGVMFDKLTEDINESHVVGDSSPEIRTGRAGIFSAVSRRPVPDGQQEPGVGVGHDLRVFLSVNLELLLVVEPDHGDVGRVAGDLALQAVLLSLQESDVLWRDCHPGRV